MNILDFENLVHNRMEYIINIHFGKVTIIIILYIETIIIIFYNLNELLSLYVTLILID